MKKLFLLFCFTFASIALFSQQDTEIGRYILRNKKASQDTVYIKVGKKQISLKKGWTITEKKGDIIIQRVLEEDTTFTTKVEIPVKVATKWKIGEVKHSNDKPDKLYLNAYHFTNPKDSLLNNESYIKIPENGFVTLKKVFVKWTAITIPFAVRPSLNDTIGSKITTDLKIGASFSYNANWEKFKNRRLEAKKSILGISGGIGFGFSKVTLNSSSTSLLEEPYKYEEDGLALFIAPGIGLNLKGFQINFSYGWDIPITSNVNDWNYANKGYLGIGLGVGINVFGKL